MMSKNFEKSIEELEAVVKNLEDGKLSLNDSIDEFERGMKLVKECRDELTKAKQKVTRILNNGEEALFEEITIDE